MRVLQVYVRFYKSLNYDYEFKARHPEKEAEWQRTDQGWLPHIRIPLEPDVTAVVGANESGKSQLLDAIEILFGDEPNERRGFCRYSPLYSVEDGLRRLPEFAADLEVETEHEVEVLASLNFPVGVEQPFFFCRPGLDSPYVSTAAGEPATHLSSDQLLVLEGIFPKIFRLRTDDELPEVVPMHALVPEDRSERMPPRRTRISLLRLLTRFIDEGTVAANAAEIEAQMNSDADVEGASLAAALLTQVAHIAPDSFLEVTEALERNGEGEVAGLIEQMNSSIARHLNLQRWWTQDEAFQLRLSVQDHEITFAVRDRTGTVYSISERSRGLKFFLAYFVNLLTHDRPSDRRELVLIDEPDAYLSAAGQQDLLRLIEDYSGSGPTGGAQTVYVTHSPFLINKNAGHRIRVIEKGVGEEGTRVVKNATQNRYEPLRTALGAFVAETAFIGGSNLFVEGPADQILLAGMSSYRLRRGAPPSKCFDLNSTTVVASGGADSVPYMTYLARGRGETKPPCVALLDGDASGKAAIKRLKKIEANNKRVLPDEFIVDLAEWAAGRANLKVQSSVTVTEIEDLISLPVAVSAMGRYATRLLGCSSEVVDELTTGAVEAALQDAGGSVWEACADLFQAVCGESLEKVGFAREVIDYLNEPVSGRNRPTGVADLETNFGHLVEHLSERLRDAVRSEAENRRSRRLDRIIDGFLADFPAPCLRDRAALMLREVEAAADETEAGDKLLASTRAIFRDFQIGSDPLELVPDYQSFVELVGLLKYVARE